MKKFLLFALITWPFLANAQQWVARDSATCWLRGLDTDTIVYVFPSNQLQKRMQSDTTKGGLTAWRPPDFIRAAGDFSLWLDKLNSVGTPDSFKVFYKAIDPFSGRLARNESTFVVGSASTFGAITSTSRYDVTLATGFGVAFVIRCADTSLDTVYITTKLTYSQ